MLLEEFLKPMGLPQKELADSIQVPYQKIADSVILTVSDFCLIYKAGRDERLSSDSSPEMRKQTEKSLFGLLPHIDAQQSVHLKNKQKRVRWAVN
jgi:hypothetical protein